MTPWDRMVIGANLITTMLLLLVVVGLEVKLHYL